MQYDGNNSSRFKYREEIFPDTGNAEYREINDATYICTSHEVNDAMYVCTSHEVNDATYVCTSHEVNDATYVCTNHEVYVIF